MALDPDLIALLDRSVAFYGRGTPTPAAELRAALAAIVDPGLVPPDYVEFIGRYGGCYVGVGAHGLVNASVVGREDVVTLTREFRSDLSPRLDDALVFSMDGSGNPIWFDRRGFVLLSDHDTGEETVLAESFAALLRAQVDPGPEDLPTPGA